MRQISLTFQARTGRRGRGGVQVPQLFIADSWPLATCNVTLKVCCRSWSCSELLSPKGLTTDDGRQTDDVISLLLPDWPHNLLSPCASPRVSVPRTSFKITSELLLTHTLGQRFVSLAWPPAGPFSTLSPGTDLGFLRANDYFNQSSSEARMPQDGSPSERTDKSHQHHQRNSVSINPQTPESFTEFHHSKPNVTQSPDNGIPTHYP